MENPQQQPAIEIQGLTKRYGRVTALDRVSFAIPAGVIAGFVGPNGSGKTTTMRILATLLKPDAGTARVFGLDTASSYAAREVRRSIGFMPDYFGLYTDMTAGQYLDFFAAAYRVPETKRARLVDDILALVNLTDKKDTLIPGLSRGMQQKLTLGRALIHSPQLLLLDEPASGLDPRARIELMELLRELRDMGKTIFISSHILTELHQLCDMVVIMEKGQTVYTGSLANAADNLMEGRRVMELTIQGDPEAAMEIVKTLDGVTGIRNKERVLLIEHGPAVDGADILSACVRNGIRVAEARRGSASLEEIFLHLTGNAS